MQYSEDELKAKTQDLYLLLNVAVAEPVNSQTRALTGDDYFEQAVLNTEKMTSLRVIIIENGPDDTQHNIKYNYKETYLNAPRFITSGLKFKVDFECKYKIYLIANEEGLAEDVQETLRDLQEESVYVPSYLEDIILQADIDSTDNVLLDNTSLNGGSLKPVPMTEIFGVDACPAPTGDPEYINVSLVKDAFVTRAATKFSFSIVDEGNSDIDIDVKAIKITGLGEKEFLFPKDTEYSPVKDIPSSEPYGGREITSFDLPEENGIGDYVFTLPENIKSGSEYAPPIYFTESKGNAEGKKFTCSISFDGENYLGPAELPNLDMLPRNTHVKVLITIKNHSFKASVSLVPYIGCFLDPWFGLPDDTDEE